MTKKHFIELAALIRGANARNDTHFSPYAIEALAAFCKSSNPRFNRERWLGYIVGTNDPNGGKVKHVKGV